VPVGVAIDRYSPRALIVAGAALMFAGQLVLALAPGIGIAVVGRVLVGAGDAMTFLSANRLLASWFSGRTLPMVSQLLGTTGQFGQLLSAIPFSILLQWQGWTTAYLTAASASLLAFVLVLMLVSPPPEPLAVTAPVFAAAARTPLKTLRESLARPGTQLGFWSHFVTQSPVTILTLLWGFPFLSVALGYGPVLAAG